MPIRVKVSIAFTLPVETEAAAENWAREAVTRLEPDDMTYEFQRVDETPEPTLEERIRDVSAE